MNDEAPQKQNFIHNKRILHGVCVAAIVTLALWLRIDGLNWGLPFRLHPDEWKYVSAGANLHAGEWNPNYFRNPPGFSYLNAAWYPLWLRIAPDVDVPEWFRAAPLTNPSRDPAIALYERPYQLTYGARALAALLGTLTVLIVYAIGRELGSKRLAILAALFSSVSFIGVRESHFAVNDSAGCFWAVLSIYIGTRAMGRNARLEFLLAAFVSGVAVAMKYNMAPAVLAVMAMWFLTIRRHASIKQVVLDIGLCAALSIIAFLIVCPFPLVDPQTFFAEIEKLGSAAARPWPGQDASWSGWQLIKSIVLSEGVIASFLALYGALIWFREKKWAPFLFFVGYFVLVAIHPLFFVRFSLPILPYVSLFAACGALALAKRAPQKTIALGFIALLCIIEPLAKDVRSNWLFHQTDTRVLCLEWLSSEQPAAGYIAGGQFTLPLPYRTNVEPWGTPVDLRHITIDRLASQEFQKLNQLDKAVLGVLVSWFDSFPGYVPDSLAQRRRAAQALVNKRKPLKTFHPLKEPTPLRDANVEDTYHPVTQLWSRKRPGPMIEAYFNP